MKPHMQTSANDHRVLNDSTVTKTAQELVNLPGGQRL